ncbi:MAG: amino acid transporter, partial [Sphingobacteriaceae bacterium]
FVVGLIVFWKPFLALFHYTGDHDKLPYFLFIGLSAVVTVLAFIKNLSLIPVLGLLSCFYLMTELGYTNWLRFLIWLIIGLVIYFTYGYRNSKLNKTI